MSIPEQSESSEQILTPEERLQHKDEAVEKLKLLMGNVFHCLSFTSFDNAAYFAGEGYAGDQFVATIRRVGAADIELVDSVGHIKAENVALKAKLAALDVDD